MMEQGGVCRKEVVEKPLEIRRETEMIFSPTQVSQGGGEREP